MGITNETTLTEFLAETSEDDFNQVLEQIAGFLENTPNNSKREPGQTYKIITFADLAAIPNDAREDFTADFLQGLSPFRDVVINAYELADALGMSEAALDKFTNLSWTDDGKPTREYKFRT